MHELAYSRAEAAEFGTAFAPPGDNLLLTGGPTASLDDLVAGTERGLLLTCLWYIREVDPTTLLLTGLTRDGVYLVEHGEVVAEVDHNFRFNYSPLDVLRRATEVGATERTLPREWKDWFTRAAMPPVRVPGVQHVVGVAGPLTARPLGENRPALLRSAVALGCRRRHRPSHNGVGDPSTSDGVHAVRLAVRNDARCSDRKRGPAVSFEW